jgi:neutral ceramidase
MMDRLQAGWARRDITPPVGIHMGGYWGRSSGATGIHDPLYARLLAWTDGTVTAVLISLDVVALAPAWVARIRRQVSAVVPGTAEDTILVSCTHTHAGPLTLNFRGMGDVDGTYLQQICERVCECAREAAASFADAQLAYARASVQIGINRRQARAGAVVIGENPQGAVAPHAHVLTVHTTEGQAVIFQHACHPVVLGNSNHVLSADFPGAACAEVERRMGGAFSMFVNGAAGDINPRGSDGSFAAVANLGQELGVAVAFAAQSAQTLKASPVVARSHRLDLPLMPPPPSVRAATERVMQGLKVALKSMSAAGEWSQRVPKAQLEWSRAWLETARNPQPAETQTFEIQGLRLGGLTWLGMEGEIFVRYQLDIEAAAAAPVVLCGYANGCIGYVPTQEEYERGGYEVDEAFKVYPSVLMIAPESDSMIRQAVTALLAQLEAD